MNNLRENTRISIQEPMVPEKGFAMLNTRSFRERPRMEPADGSLNPVSHESKVNAPVEDSRERRRPRQMMLPGVEFGDYPSISNRRFTFDQFVVGPCNRFAYGAAWAVANDKRNAYNPLYFYGGSGLGKSHLAGAIGNHIHGTEPAAQILCTTAEEFFNEMVSAIRKKEMWGFKEKYRRRCDVFVIDGVHFFSGKEKTQTELSHTLDHLYNSGKQVILTGTMPPNELSHMTDSLKSRLACGLVVDLHPPDLDTRRRILLHKAKVDNVELPDNVLEFLAFQTCGNVRTLEGLLVNLIAKSSLLSRPICLELAQEVAGSFQMTANQKVTIELVQRVVARQYHQEVEQLISRSRRKSVCHPRQMAMYLCRKFTEESLDTIGRAFCRDHASVIHAIGVIERQIRERAGVRREFEFLVKKLGRQCQ